MHLARPSVSPKNENTITLINVVFLMLIFFLVAGTLTPPLDQDVRLIDANAGEPVPPPDTLSARENGDVYFRGATITVNLFLEELRKKNSGSLPKISVVADKELPAHKLIDLIAEIRQLGAEKVSVITKRETR